MRHVIIGLGSMGQRHLFILKQLRPDDIFVTVDTDGKADFSSPRGDICDESLVYICSPTRWHWIHLDFIVRYGNPRAVFIEKPLFETGSENLGGGSFNFPIAIGYQYRFHPVFQQLKREQNEDRRIFSFHVYASDSSCARYGSALESLLSHPISTSQWLFGDMAENDAGDTETIAYFTAKSKSGVDISMSANTLSGQRISLVILGWMNNIYRIHEQQVLNIWADEDMYVRQMEQWLRYVETGERGDLCGLEEALAIQ